MELVTTGWVRSFGAPEGVVYMGGFVLFCSFCSLGGMNAGLGLGRREFEREAVAYDRKESFRRVGKTQFCIERRKQDMIDWREMLFRKLMERWTGLQVYRLCSSDTGQESSCAILLEEKCY